MGGTALQRISHGRHRPRISVAPIHIRISHGLHRPRISEDRVVLCSRNMIANITTVKVTVLISDASTYETIESQI